MSRQKQHIKILQEELGHQFNRPELLRSALTHPSLTAARHQVAARVYERLEFLGDRVVGLIAAELLLEHFPAEQEGSIAYRHSALVRRETLAKIAMQVSLGDALQHQAMPTSQPRGIETILADAFEALIAAFYLDAGLDPVVRFLKPHFLEELRQHTAPPKDHKTAIQEWLQARGLGLPSYNVINQSGPAHEPNFIIEISAAGITAIGEGRSKRIAEMAAAAKALEVLVSAHDE